MKKYVIYWLHGDKTVVKGYDIADAFRRAGFGGGSIRAVDYYKEVKDEKDV